MAVGFSNYLKAGLFSLLWLPLVLSPVAGLAAQTGTADSKNKLAVLRERITELQNAMQLAEGEHSQLSHQLQATEQEIGVLARKLRVLAGRLDRQDIRLDKLQQQEQLQQKALQSERHNLAQQIRSAYMMGRQERLKILLNQQDPALFSRSMIYYDYMNRTRAERMADIDRQLKALVATRAEIRAEEGRLRKLLQAQQAERDALETVQGERRDVIRRLAITLKQQGQEMVRLRDDEKQLQTLLRGLEEALADIPAEMLGSRRFGELKGALAWPSKGVIAHSFGTAKIGSLKWDGVMIAAPEGNEVRAVHHGRVAFADWLRGFGLLLIIEHGDGYMTLYGHNQSLFKEAGDWVDAGEPVALVGSSGGREQSAVYFGIRKKGKPLNPSRWCRTPQGRKVG